MPLIPAINDARECYPAVRPRRAAGYRSSALQSFPGKIFLLAPKVPQTGSLEMAERRLELLCMCVFICRSHEG
jgi:hypothetical protein